MHAQVTGQLALLSDYRYRGESLSAGRPALQAGIDYQNASGVFAGALGSTARVDPEVSGLAGQLYGGYARALSATTTWELGAVAYLFPSPRTEPSYTYAEVFTGATWERIATRLYYTERYFGGGRAGYVEVNASQPLGSRITLLEHVGLLSLSDPRQRSRYAQESSVFDAQIGIGTTLAGFDLELSVVGTTAAKKSCPTGSGRCGASGLFAVSRKF